MAVQRALYESQGSEERRGHMGSIREEATGAVRILGPEHVVGRASTCALQIDQRFVSAQQAVIRWNSESWELRDLGSRNGTFLDGVRLQPGIEQPLAPGARIAFGKKEHEWVLVDDAAPMVMAVPANGSLPILLDGELLAIPSSEDPRATIYRGADGSWILEQPDDSSTPITNLQSFEVTGQSYRFHCPEGVNRTSLATASVELEVRHLELVFAVSRDEEHVQLQVNCGLSRFDLGARAHNYLLLTLARRRVDDAREGLPDTSCGWIYLEDLAHDPSFATPQLNIDVFRIRKQFSSVGVLDAANIVERRPRTRQIRLGASRVSILTF
jgi:hypothetical protein